VVIEAEVNKTRKTTLRSEPRSTLKKDLTELTLLEMSGLRVPGLLTKASVNHAKLRVDEREGKLVEKLVKRRVA
jgi:hypothetical protein